MKNIYRLPLIILIVQIFLVLAVYKFAQEPENKVRVFEFTYESVIEGLPPGARNVQIWIPLPAEDRYQRIVKSSIETSLPCTIEKESEYGNRLLYSEIAEFAGTPLRINMRFIISRQEARTDTSRVIRRAEPAGVTARDLAPDSLIPLEGEIARTASLTVDGIQDDLEKARAIYEYVLRNMRYDKEIPGWGRGDALRACRLGVGNCTDFHSLFIGLARASGIPARFSIGFPIPAGGRGGKIPGYHCWAEFYVKDAGWIPIDVSEAWKYPSLADYYFGNIDVNRVKFVTGRDLRLPHLPTGEKLNLFIYPLIHVNGKTWVRQKSEFYFRDTPEERKSL